MASQLAMTDDQRFRRRERVRRRCDYARAFAEGRRAGNNVLVIYVAENGLAWSRLGLSVGKRVGNAVRRHYVRRMIREAFRMTKADLPQGLDIICVAKPQAGNRQSGFARMLPLLVTKAVRRKRRVRDEGTTAAARTAAE